MKSLLRMLQAALLTACLSAVAGAADDPVFRAMDDELKRSVTQLKMKDTSPPYFVSYRIADTESATSEARYGAPTSTDRTRSRHLYAEVRAGNATFDNTGFAADWDDLHRMRDDLPDEDDYRAIRHQLWLVTDKAYKNALETLARKQAYLQTHPSTDSLPDFSAAEPVEVMETPVRIDGSSARTEAAVVTAVRVLGEFPALQDWKASSRATAANRRYVNSDGSKYLKGITEYSLEITATVQAADGERLSAFLRYIVPEADALPGDEELTKDVRRLASDLTAAAAAPVLDEYSGPVLFTDYAAAQVVSQLFVTQTSPPREIKTSQDFMKRYLPAPGKLAGRVNRRVMPGFMTVIDDPSLRDYQGQPLIGHQVVDDEGVPSRTITLVKDGRLVTLPSSRQPIRSVARSNGHALTLENQATVPAITNLLVSSAKGLPREQLVKKLRQTCQESGSEYGLMVTLLEDRAVSRNYTWAVRQDNDPPMLSAPVLMYKVYAKDGRIEPVRGLVFDEVSIRSLRDILAAGKESRAYPVLQSALRDFQYTASIVTPPLLFEEMELKAGAEHEPLPVSANPIFAD